MTDQERTDAIQGLKDLADFLDAHPGVPAPRYVTLNVFLDTRDDIASVARLASWEKDYNGNWFALRRRFRGDLTLDLCVARSEVCRKVVVGTRTVPAVEAQPARVEPVEEWVCEEVSLLNEAGR